MLQVVKGSLRFDVGQSSDSIGNGYLYLLLIGLDNVASGQIVNEIKPPERDQQHPLREIPKSLIQFVCEDKRTQHVRQNAHIIVKESFDATISGIKQGLEGELPVECQHEKGPYDLGVCYGMQGDNLPQPRDAVNLYLNHRIHFIRLYDPNPVALEALRSSIIGVTVGIPNDMLKTIASEPTAASGWLKLNILPYFSDVFFQYIAVGNDAIPGDQAQFVLPAMKNLNTSIWGAGIGAQIRVTTVIGMRVLAKSHPPSAASFSDRSMEYMRPIVRFLDDPTTGVILVNVYPYFAYVGSPKGAISLEYALFTAQGTVVQDGVLGYQNLFHAMIDAIYWALEDVGSSWVHIIVSETGWPTAGGNAATIHNAQMYISNLIRHANQGTPKRPFGILDFFISALFDENLKRPQGVANHFGLFYPDKRPVYLVNFTS